MQLTDPSGILCCLALEKYLGTAPPTSGDSDTPSVRARYLKRLHETWISASLLENFPEDTANRSDSNAPEELAGSDPDVVSCTSDEHRCFIHDLERSGICGTVPTSAFEDGNISIETKARILQMVMQCSVPSKIAGGGREGGATVAALVSRLAHIRRRARDCTFEERVTLILLARKYNDFLTDAQAQMDKARKIRRREFKVGGVSERKPRTLATTTALNHLAEQQTVMDPKDLKVSVHDGCSLLYIVNNLGHQGLATFPGTTVPPHQFVLNFPAASSCFKLLSRAINSTE